MQMQRLIVLMQFAVPEAIVYALFEQDPVPISSSFHRLSDRAIAVPPPCHAIHFSTSILLIMLHDTCRHPPSCQWLMPVVWTTSMGAPALCRETIRAEQIALPTYAIKGLFTSTSAFPSQGYRSAPQTQRRLCKLAPTYSFGEWP